MRNPLARFATKPASALSENPELSEVLRALAEVTREDQMRSQLIRLAEQEESRRSKA